MTLRSSESHMMMLRFELKPKTALKCDISAAQVVRFRLVAKIQLFFTFIDH